MYRLRELEQKDIQIINSWRANKEFIDCLGAPFRYINKEVDQKWYDNYMANRDKNIRCSIVNENDHIIGLISLTNIDRINQSAIFHIMIGNSDNREKGVGYFATNEMLKHAFFDMNFNRIELTVLESNKRAINLYDKIGFKREGIKRDAVYKNGVYANMILMAILKKDYNNKADII